MSKSDNFSDIFLGQPLDRGDISFLGLAVRTWKIAVREGEY